MEELNTLYKELQERNKYLEGRKKTKKTKGRIKENLLATARVQQLILSYLKHRSIFIDDLKVNSLIKEMESYKWEGFNNKEKH